MIHRPLSDNRTMSHISSVYRECYDDNIFINNGQYDVIHLTDLTLQPYFCLIMYILIHVWIHLSVSLLISSLFNFHVMFCRCIYLYSPLFDVLMLPYFSLYVFCMRYCLVCLVNLFVNCSLFNKRY